MMQDETTSLQVADRESSPETVGAAPRIAVLMTCFNRKSKTLDCLEALFANTASGTPDLEVFLVDDGSTDGTKAAVQQRFSSVNVISGAGNLFWCRGMHRAFAAAQTGSHDFYLWLNDDTSLQPDALARLLECESSLRAVEDADVIIVGSTVEAATGVLTYGGERRVSPLRPLRFSRIQPSDKPQLCDSMNGNIVLVPRRAAARLGNLDPAFEHAMGDTDYALRARRMGIGVWVAPGVHGTCSSNPVEGTYADAGSSLRRRWRHVTSRKCLPWRSWLVMTRRHGGLAWPALFVWPYISVLIGRYGR